MARASGIGVDLAPQFFSFLFSNRKACGERRESVSVSKVPSTENSRKSEKLKCNKKEEMKAIRKESSLDTCTSSTTYATKQSENYLRKNITPK